MQEFYNKLCRVQANLVAPKNQRNTFGNYNYRSLEDILEAVKPLLAKEGLCLVIGDEVVEVGGRIYIKATATISDGSRTICNTAFAREDDSRKGMSAEQLTGSCSSYARKYCVSGLFCIDDCKDADTNEARAQASGVSAASAPEESKKKPTTRKAQDVCAECGKAIVDTEFNGVHYTKEKIIEVSKRKHNKALCLECGIKAKGGK